MQSFTKIFDFKFIFIYSSNWFFIKTINVKIHLNSKCIKKKKLVKNRGFCLKIKSWYSIRLYRREDGNCKTFEIFMEFL